MELLSAKHPGIPPTLRDDRLSEEVIRKYFSQSEHVRDFALVHFGNERVVSDQFMFDFVRKATAVCFYLSPCLCKAEQLRQHYMTKYDSEVADAHQGLQPVLQNIKELKRKVRTPLYLH